MLRTQLTDDFVRSAVPGMQGLDELRAQLLRSTAAQREEEQKERCAQPDLALSRRPFSGTLRSLQRRMWRQQDQDVPWGGRL